MRNTLLKYKYLINNRDEILQLEFNTTQLTPMMQQYMQIKSEYPEYMLFYRMGDFYELFFDDAVKAASALDIVLTKRGKHEDADIPMCGVPVHSHESYLEKLIKSGFKVAICEQMESPLEAKKRGYKAVVKREVTRVITSGTIIEDSLLNAKQFNFMCCISNIKGELSISAVEITTGILYVSKTSAASLLLDISKFSPKEVVISDSFYRSESSKGVVAEYQRGLSVRSDSVFNLERSIKRISDFYKIKSLVGLGDYNDSEIIAIGALIEYLEHTQKSYLPRLSKPKRISSENFMEIDSSTKKNLEIETSISGDKKFSLIAVLDNTSTSGGGRLLSLYLNMPLADKVTINKRLDSVQFFVDEADVRVRIENLLKQFPDIERSLARICMNRGELKDLAAIKQGLKVAASVSEHLLFSGIEIPSNIKIATSELVGFTPIFEILESTLKPEMPPLLKSGDFINAGVNAELDSLYDLKYSINEKLDALRDKYRNLTGATALKISFNNVLGYFIEVTPMHKDKVADEIFIHKQTLGSSIRFVTEELKDLEEKINSCDEKISNIEKIIFNELCSKVSEYADNIAIAAHAISSIDVYSALAKLASQMNYTRPIVDDSSDFSIESGRHPVVEKALKNKFISNNSDFKDSSLILLTGPNMAGKSTFLRQNALIAIMAQIGSFVPASSASIGVVDKIFSRIGASDDISKGQSTFMVEMSETAAIINNATSKSLVILDEIGRGTATYDGLSIAWAVIEELHDNIKCRTFFATHYHELTDLEGKLEKLKCYTMNVKEWDGKLVFLHEVIAGKADRSYGIHVAQLAGIPERVTSRASEILEKLQSENSEVKIELSSKSSNDNKIVDRLKDVDINMLTPKDAFDLIYSLKKIC